MSLPKLPFLLMLVLGGIVVNVAVAWGCAMWSEFPSANREVMPTEGDWPREVSARWPREQILISTERAFGLTSRKAWAVVQKRKDPAATLSRYLDLLHDQDRARDASLQRRIETASELLLNLHESDGLDNREQVDLVTSLLRQEAKSHDESMRNEIRTLILSLTDRSTNFSFFVREAGWPMRALDAEARSDQSLQPRGRHAIQLPRIQSGFLVSSGRWIPLNPMWPGFAVNSLLFALLLWPVFSAPATIRRMLRKKAGLCPCCGTPIGVESSCLQCGQDLHDFWRS